MLAVRQMLRYKDIQLNICADISVVEEELTRAQMVFDQLCGASR